MIEIVIKIPKELYEAYKDRPPMLGDIGMDMIAQSIANGTPLPKGHGDLVDRSELLDWSYQIDSMYCMYDEVVSVDDIKNAPTIIEGSENE